MFELALAGDAREQTIDRLHTATAYYTALPEIEALLDGLEWPSGNDRILDPGAGNGGMLVAALARLELAVNDIDTATHRVHGYEIHRGAAMVGRLAIADHLVSRGWNVAIAREAAERILDIRDFLLSPVPVAQYQTIIGNPPYWRLMAHLDPTDLYRIEYEAVVPAHARADLLYAYLQRIADIAIPGVTRVGLVTSDRWLINSGSTQLRKNVGERYTILTIKRLDPLSAFYRPKSRKKGTPARVHPVSIILAPDRRGRLLDASPFQIDDIPAVEGLALPEIADIRLAPWLGPDGIFMVTDPTPFPADALAPCVEPEDINYETGELEPRRWALLTHREAEPHPAILAHLDKTLDRMPLRGRQRVRWLPPEPFAHRLPLVEDAVLVPRIAKTLRGIKLPQGIVPGNHNLVVISRKRDGEHRAITADRMIAILSDPRVQAQADAIAPRVDGGYLSYTATHLRKLIVPHDLL